MKKILIVSQIQFGYLIDYYQYSIHLNQHYNITYLCWDYNKVQLELDGVEIIYISRNGNLFLRNLRFIKEIIHHLNSNIFDIVLINYFMGCFVLPFFNKKKAKLILDIRTAAVFPSAIKRWVSDSILWFECFFYQNISIISEGVRKRLKLPKKTMILPLGANEICVERKKIEGIHLLYVGTLSNRNIHDTIIGLKKFKLNYPEIITRYTIIGKGSTYFESLIKESVTQNELSEIVLIKGYIPTDKLEPFFKDANIGVAYVPMTKYYHNQPPTKTFEYLMSGIPVIATKTLGNSDIINEKNGVLINDNPEDFYLGIVKIMENQTFFNEDEIRKTVENNEWSKITSHLYTNIFNSK
jgi:glycosyltransferase involved in cell wall biosynthesis